MALTDNLVAYWSLDGNSNDSVGSHTGTDSNITYSAAKISDGAVFNGTTSTISFADSADWNFGTGDFSISFWVSLNSLTQDSGYIGFLMQYTSTNYWIIQYDNNLNTLYLYSKASSTNQIKYSVPFSPSTDTFYHIVVTRTGTTWVTYINGSAGSNTLNLGAYTGTMPNSTGALYLMNDSESVLHSGTIDEVGIWKGKALSGAEVTQLYNGGAGLAYPLTVASAFIPKVIFI